MKPCIVMQTDFGMGGGAMFGVCKCIDPELQLYDMAHTLPKFNVEKASSSLRNAIIYWPKGTGLRVRCRSGRRHIAPGIGRKDQKRLLYRDAGQRLSHRRAERVRH